MERATSVEDKIRRAEEIYAKRHINESKHMATVNVNGKKEVKLYKKLIIQILISLCIYLIIYNIQIGNYIFSEDFISRAKEILSYDIDFEKIYNMFNSSNLNKQKENIEDTEEKENLEEKQEQKDDGIGGGDDIVPLSQEEQDIISIKETTSFIKPVEGVISSKYGLRNPTTNTVPKNHTGTDIAANLGTKILSSTDGDVELVSNEGDYGKHIKIKIEDVSIIYAHCNNIYVNEGDKIVQGQEIAEVGSTGNSTGPHLHFEIRISERTVDPERILEL